MKNIRIPIGGHWAKRVLLFSAAILMLLPIVSVSAREALPAAPGKVSMAQAVGDPAAGDPAITLVSPERGRKLNTPNVQFQWSATGNTTGKTYHIRVLLDGDEGIVVQEASGITGTSITFRLFDGNYAWYVLAENAAGNVTANSDTWWFQVVDEDEGPPEVTVTSPNGGEEIPANSEFTITWAIVDDLTSIPDLKINIDLSTNGGGNWQNIVSNMQNDGAFLWHVPSANTTQALIRVIAEDRDQKKGLDVSDTTFSIIPGGN